MARSEKMRIAFDLNTLRRKFAWVLGAPQFKKLSSHSTIVTNGTAWDRTTKVGLPAPTHGGGQYFRGITRPA